MRAQFIAKEIWIGLRRNLTMTVAVIVSVAISLALLGGGLLLGKQVNTMKDYWYDKVEVSLFLCGQGSDAASCANGAVTDTERTQIRKDLESLKPLVKNVYYESKSQAYDRFKRQFRDSAIAQNVTPEQMPESYRVKLSDPTKFDIVATAFAGRPGVEQVLDQRTLFNRLFSVLNVVRSAAWTIAGIELFAALLLIANTIRLSAYSRRRETGIMRLVGASSFYIQLPFLLEGAIAGLVGAAIASGALIAAQKWGVEAHLAPTFRFTAFIGWPAVWSTIPLLLLIGVAISVLASFVTLRRHLRV